MFVDRRRDTLITPAVALLNSNVAEFDTIKVRECFLCVPPDLLLSFFGFVCLFFLVIFQSLSCFISFLLSFLLFYFLFSWRSLF